MERRSVELGQQLNHPLESVDLAVITEEDETLKGRDRIVDVLVSLEAEAVLVPEADLEVCLAHALDKDNILRIQLKVALLVVNFSC